MIMVFMFSYVPICGWIISFYEYRTGVPLFENEFVGFKYFKLFFTDKQVLRVIKNTLIFSGIGYALAPLPMVFAILLNEIKSTRFRKIAQTITTLPNFISWVIVYALAFALFSTDGVVNEVLKMFGSDKVTNLLTNKDIVYLFQTIISQWKGLGWGSIIYIAAIAGIDQELYEAAAIDGAGRFGSAIHITLPGLMPTFITLLILSISNLINTGFQQYFVFKNSVVYDKLEVLDLYIYKQGLQIFDYSYSTAVGMIKSVISIVMLTIANIVAKRVRGNSIF
ncbi:MAG: sugar ABC transporter permease [Clostridiales bacterium]|nr:sugar ABC transporter permease [Clostridiales bacterium]